jgi:hypothetical protein
MSRRQVQMFLLILAIIGAWIYFTFYYQKYPRHDWNVSYDVESTEPYGLSVVVNLLKNFGATSTVTISEKSIAATNLDQYKNYLLIGSSFYFTEHDQDALINFISSGHHAMILSDYFPGDFIGKISNVQDSTAEENNYKDSFLESVNDSLGKINFYLPQLHAASDYTVDYRYIDKIYSRRWSFFSNHEMAKIKYPVELIGYISRETPVPNLIRVRIGNGELILCCTPIAFTNYHLRNATNLDYTEKVFSWLSSGPILLDEVSKIPSFGKDAGSNETPLRFILSKDALRWAWYLLLSAILLFLLFRSKRRQRIIPVITQRENSSLDYIRLVSRLFHKQKNHHYLCTQTLKLFLSFIRNRYRISTTEINEQVIQTVSVKSGVAKNEVEEIFSQGRTLSQYDEGFLDEEEVKYFYKLTESFYKKCK